MIAAAAELLVGTSGGEGDDAMDGNEPLYCYCQQPSFGEMVGCENGDCPTEWFHYEVRGNERASLDRYTVGAC